MFSFISLERALSMHHPPVKLNDLSSQFCTTSLRDWLKQLRKVHLRLHMQACGAKLLRTTKFQLPPPLQIVFHPLKS